MPPTIHPNPIFTVYFKPAWADEWEEAVYWEPKQVQRLAAPSISSARLLFRAGKIKRADSDELTTEAIPEKAARFVKITVKADAGEETEEELVFIGYSPAENLRQFAYNDTTVDTGDLELMVYGLEYLLDNVTMDGAWCAPGNMDEETDPAVWITRSLPFNQKDDFGFLGIGNRSADKVASTRPSGAESYLFDLDYDPLAPPTPGDPEATWTAEDIVEYALVRFGATDNYGTGIEFELSGQQSALANWLPPRLNVAGKTVRAVLNHLIDRRRGVGWYIDWGLDETPLVAVFTAVAADVTSNGYTIPANAGAAPLDLSADLRVESPSLTTDLNTRFGRITARGAPIKVTLTIPFEETEGEDPANGLTPAWEADTETAYLAATDEARSLDTYQRVYQSFMVAADFDWKGKAGVMVVADDGTVTAGPSPMRRWGRLLNRQLTLYDDLGELRRPFVVGKALGDDGEERYFYLDKPPLEKHGAHVQMMDDAPGLTLRANGLNHVLARGVFDAAETAEPSQVEPVFDYRTMQATVCTTVDAVLEVRETIAGADPDRELVINMPQAETWVVMTGTVTDLDAAGALVTAGATTLERDDKDKLQAIVAMAKAWYAFPRSALSFGLGTLDLEFWHLGDVATTATLGATANTVNTPCTAITYDCEHHKMHYTFGWGELDFAAIGGFAS